MNDRHAIHDAAEDAALYVAGALTPEAAAVVDARLAAGSPDLAAEVASYDAVVLALAATAEPVVPNPATKRALLERVTLQIPRQQPGRAQRTEVLRRRDEVFVRRANSVEWHDYGIPGVEFCILHRDRARNLQTALVRAAAGSELPGHAHPVVEECLVLEGDFESHGTTLLAGDYLRAPAGSEHPLTRTQGGCLLLVTSEIR